MKIFHHNDMDGFGSLYIVAKNVINPNIDSYNYDSFIKVNYETNVADKFALAHDEDVYIVDYSFTEATKYQLDGLFERNCNVVWIDHHISSINLQEQYMNLKTIRGIRNTSMSGAALCYIYFRFKDRDDFLNNLNSNMISICPDYIKYISDYDTFTHDYEESNYFKLGYDVYKNKMKLFNDIEKSQSEYNPLMQNPIVNKVIMKGRSIKEYIDSDNSFYCNTYSYESEMYDGTKCIVVNKRSNSWIFGDKYKKYPICVVEVFNGTEWQYSLFSSFPDVDCSKYAEHYGGGGHKGAAGFRNKELLFKKV